MKKYIVAVLMLQGLRKQPFEGGDEVVAENFPAGQFETLIEKGFIKEAELEEKEEVVPDPPSETPEQKAEREAKEAEEAAANSTANNGELKTKGGKK